MQIKQKYFYFGGPDKGLTLLLRISIRDRKSGLRSSLGLKTIYLLLILVLIFFLEKFVFIIIIFLKLNLILDIA